MITRAAHMRRILLAGCATLALSAAVHPALAQDGSRAYAIPSEDLGAALRDFGVKSGKDVVFDAALVQGKKSPKVEAKLSDEYALGQLLAGSGLKFAKTPSGSFVVEAGGSKNVQAAANEAAAATAPLNVESVVVTGTNIAGASPVGSKLDVYTKQDIERSGAGTIDRFIQTLPQNFNGGASQVSYGGLTTGDATANTGAGATVNLRGLGNGSTLVLLDGQRMAPAGSDGSFVDISMIPVSAIQRVEILTDGASAIYGSDAVAGVANFILRKDLDGQETSLRFGSDANSVSEWRADQSIGRNWGSGGVFAAYSYYNRDPLFARDRSFTSSAPSQAQTILPSQTMNSVLLDGFQDIGTFHGFGHFLYSHRNSFTALPDFTKAALSLVTSNDQLDGSVGGTYDITPSWAATITANFGQTGQDNVDTGNPITKSATTTFSYLTKSSSIEGRINGSLLALPAGEVKIAAGASYRHDAIDHFFSATSTSNINRSRDVISGYGEVLLPLVADEMNVPLVETLEASAAIRYDSYSDFGSSTNPKVGIDWRINSWAFLRGSYSTSFRAPLLANLVESPLLLLNNAIDSASPTGKSLTLYSAGSGNASLQAETSRDWTVGGDITPPDFPIKLSASYFDINFSNRIGRAATNLNQYLATPSLYGSLITRNPSAAFVTSQLANATSFTNLFGPFTTSNVAIFVDARTNNLAVVQESGIDLDLSSHVTIDSDRFDFGLNATEITALNQQVTIEAPSSNALNQVGGLVGSRLRGTVSWERGDLTAFVALNYTGGTRNVGVTPAQHVEALTTVDAQISYAVPSGTEDEFWSNTEIAIGVQNLFDQDPPIVLGQVKGLNYDPANSDPLGRFVSLSLQKTW